MICIDRLIAGSVQHIMRDRKDAKIFEEKIKRRNILKFVILSLILTFL